MMNFQYFLMPIKLLFFKFVFLFYLIIFILGFQLFLIILNLKFHNPILIIIQKDASKFFSLLIFLELFKF